MTILKIIKKLFSLRFTDIGSGHFIGVSGAAAKGGIAVNHFEINVPKLD